MYIKKRNFIFVVIVCLVTGGFFSGSLNYIHKVKSGGYVSITSAEYEQYKKSDEKYAKLAQLEEYIKANFYLPVDEDALTYGMYKGLFWGLNDPYSAYLSEEQYAEVKISTTGEFQGVGVTMAPDADGYLNVVSPIDNSPAAKAGIQSGDKIVAVDGETVNGSSIDKAVAMMRGKAGTKVKVTILRDRKNLDVELVRSKIVMHSVRSEVLEDNIGYIRISSFEEKTAVEFKEHLRNLELKKVKGLIVDLRDNGGGLVEISVQVADALLDEGIVTYTQNQKGDKEYHKSKNGKTALPYVLLVNGGTASASEIVAGAIKDHQGGKLVGTQTYGKGIIQVVDPLPNGDAIKLTVMQYFSPNGNVIHNIGITPDVVVEQLADDEKDVQLEKALTLLQ